MGAGYLAGVVATALTVFAARRWRSIQPLAVALVTLSVGLLAATLLHTARFRWGYPPTWAWTGVYALAPVGVAILARRQRAITLRPLVADPGLRLLRLLSLVFGAAMLAGAIALFAFPADLGRDWPWPLTPLLAQAVAAWCAMIAAALLWCAYDLRRPHEALHPLRHARGLVPRAAGAPGAARRPTHPHRPAAADLPRRADRPAGPRRRRALVKARAVAESRARAACARARAKLAVPRTGYEAQLLRTAMESAGATETWLGYRRSATGWTATHG